MMSLDAINKEEKIPLLMNLLLTQEERGELMLSDSKYCVSIESLFSFFKKKGFTLSKSDYQKDVASIKKIINSSNSKEIADEVSLYDLFIFSTLGDGFILRDNSNEIQACLFIVYLSNGELINAFPTKLTICTDVGNEGLGTHLLFYGLFSSVSKKSDYFFMLVNNSNVKSLNICINKLGGVVTNFVKDEVNLGPHFIVKIPLGQKIFNPSSIVNKDRVFNYLVEKEEDVDYLLAEFNDYQKLQQIYQEMKYRVCYLFPKNEQGKSLLLALPVNNLGL
jgi:hypothetical protein